MVEFTLVLPVLALLLFGIIQFGIAFNNYLAVTDAVRAGTRVAVVSAPLGPSQATAKTRAKVYDSAANLDQSKLDVTVSSTWASGSDVTVTARYPYEINLLGVVVSNGYLTSSTTERVE